MDFLLLPLLDDSAAPHDALSLLRKYDVRAAIAHHPSNRFTLYMNEHLLQGHGRHFQNLSTLPAPGFSLASDPLVQGNLRLAVGHAGDPYTLIQQGRYLLRGTSIASDLEGSLRQAGSDYGILDVDANTALVVTSSEQLAQGIRLAARVCQCDGFQQHTALSPPARDGAKCHCTGTYTCY